MTADYAYVVVYSTSHALMYEKMLMARGISCNLVPVAAPYQFRLRCMCAHPPTGYRRGGRSDCRKPYRNSRYIYLVVFVDFTPHVQVDCFKAVFRRKSGWPAC